MTSTTDTERIREVVQGSPGDPPPPKREGWTPPPPEPLPVIDRDRIVEEVVTRRLVVVDSKRRERVVIEEADNPDQMMQIEVRSSDGESAWSINVGINADSDDDENGYVFMIANGRGHQVTIHTDPADASVTVESAGLGIPSATLANDALTFKTMY
jgi:hypothetical protein